MGLNTFVKISNINNLSDARYCAGMMVDILGFNLEADQEGYVSPETFKEISEWVAGVKFAGEFSTASATEIKLALTDYEVDYIEVSDVQLLEDLQELAQKIIFRQVVTNEENLKALQTNISFAQDLVEYIIIDCDSPSMFDALETELSKLKDEVRFIRAYGINEQSAQAVSDSQIFYGIELKGSPEERPGYKDYGMVMDILELLESD